MHRSESSIKIAERSAFKVFLLMDKQGLREAAICRISATYGPAVERFAEIVLA